MAPADLFGRPGSRKERLYETAISGLLDGLDQKRKALVLGLVKDIVSHYRTK